MNPKCSVLVEEMECWNYGWIIKCRKFPISQAIIWTQAEYDEQKKGKSGKHSRCIIIFHKAMAEAASADTDAASADAM